MASGGILQKIEDLINEQIPSHTLVHIIPRGVQHFIDTNLRGTVRNAKRIGNNLPTIAADNKTSLSVTAQANSSVIVVSAILNSFYRLDAILSINGTELVQVANALSNTGQIILKSPLLTTHDAGESVFLYASPISVVGVSAAGWSSGSTVVRVLSTSQILSGDQLVVLAIPGVVSSATGIKIDRIRQLNSSLSLITYELTLSSGIPRQLLENEQVYLKGQPGYISQILPVTNYRKLGPFLLDYMSGSFVAGSDVSESFSIKLYSALNSPFEPSATIDLEPVDKNYLVLSVPINNESMLFWTVVNGNIQFKNSRFTAICDSNGYFCLSTELVPSFTAGHEWNMPILPNNECLVRVKFEPNVSRDFTAPANSLTKLTVGVATGEQPATRIEIAIKGKPNTEIRFSDWAPVNDIVYGVSYGITADVIGDSTWQASSLLLKPFFKSYDRLRTRLDSDSTNNGTLSS